MLTISIAVLLLLLELVDCAWTELKPPASLDKGANFGTAVAFGSDFFAVGAFQDRNGTGSTSVFNHDATIRTSLSPQQLTPGANFGCALASRSNLLAVGAQSDSSDQSGAIYVFTVGASGAELTARLRPSSAVPSGYFGSSLAWSGRVLVTGAPAGPGRGVVHLLEQDNNGSWSERHTIPAPPVLNPGDNFGISVGTHSNEASLAIVAVGANHASNTTGAVFVYMVNDARPRLLATLHAPDRAPGDYFGSAVAVAALGGNVRVVAVGAAFRGGGRGGVYVFSQTTPGDRWDSKQLVPNATSAGNFGSSVALSTDRDALVLIVGAWQEGGKGAVYKYRITSVEGGLAIVLEARLQPEMLTAGAFFGSAVQSEAGGVLIGADGYHDRDGAAFVFEP